MKIVWTTLLAASASLVLACDSESTGQDEGGVDVTADGAQSEDLASDSGANDASQGDSDVALEDGTSASDASSDAPESLPVFRTCTGRDRTGFPSTGEFDNFTSGVKAEGQDGHSVEDIVVVWPSSAAIELEGKFAYGTLSLDLEDEPVQGWIDDCSGWQSMGEKTTNSDGRARFTVPDSVTTQPGRYEVAMVVQGDGTLARGYLLLTPAGTQFVVFDIDGTLTTGDSELFEQYFLELFGGDVVPDPWPDGAAAVQAYADAGYEVLYLTGRPYWLDAITREWLEDLGYVTGNLHLTRTLGEATPTEDGTGAYKRDYLVSIQANHDLVRAYGNATTDIYAYDQAGVPKADTFIIGENAGAEGTQAVSSYTEHLGAVTIAPAQQPFTR